MKRDNKKRKAGTGLPVLLAASLLLSACAGSAGSKQPSASGPGEGTVTKAVSDRQENLNLPKNAVVPEHFTILQDFSEGSPYTWVEFEAPQEKGGTETRYGCMELDGRIRFSIPKSEIKRLDSFFGSITVVTDQKKNAHVLDSDGKEHTYDGTLVCYGGEKGTGYLMYYRDQSTMRETVYTYTVLDESGTVLAELKFEDKPLSACYGGCGVFFIELPKTTVSAHNYYVFNAESGASFRIEGIYSSFSGEHLDVVRDGYFATRQGNGVSALNTEAVLYNMRNGQSRKLTIPEDWSIQDFTAGKAGDGKLTVSFYEHTGGTGGKRQVEIGYYTISDGKYTRLDVFEENIFVDAKRKSYQVGAFGEDGVLLLSLYGADDRYYVAGVDDKGRTVVEPIAYQSFYDYSSGRMVYNTETAGYIVDAQGKTVFTGEGYQLYGFGNGVARAVLQAQKRTVLLKPDGTTACDAVFYETENLIHLNQ